MSIEQKINYQLNKYPTVKKVVKRVYQTGMYAISPKIKSEGNITRISPDDSKHEYFFGYYDKSPKNETGEYILYYSTSHPTKKKPDPNRPINLIVFDCINNEAFFDICI